MACTWSRNRPKLILSDLDGGQRGRVSCLYLVRISHGSRCVAPTAWPVSIPQLTGDNHESPHSRRRRHRCDFYEHRLRRAQTSGSARPDLTTSQERTVSQRLANSPSQPMTSGAQPQVGSKVPDSMSAQALPSNVTDQVPETKRLLFIKLPDRILLIDPDSKLVAEMIMDDTTTGSKASGPSAGSTPGSPSSPSR